MKSYTPIEATIQAAVISTVEVVTTATLDDGSVIPAKEGSVAGDYAVQATDGTVMFIPKADFEAHFKLSV